MRELILLRAQQVRECELPTGPALPDSGSPESSESLRIQDNLVFEPLIQVLMQEFQILVSAMTLTVLYLLGLVAFSQDVR